MDKLVVKFLWFCRPFVIWFDHTFTLPATVKKVKGNIYYEWVDKFNRGTVFISDTKGQGTNILNPSKGKHGAIFFGTGLKTHLEDMIKSLELEVTTTEFPHVKDALNDQIVRLKKTYAEVEDHIPYVIEAVGKGVSATNLVSFLLTKDVIRAYDFIDDEGKTDHTTMLMASHMCLSYLNLAYDYGFDNRDDTMYCFELCVDSYQDVIPSLEFKQESFLAHKFYLASSIGENKKFQLFLHIE